MYYVLHGKSDGYKLFDFKLKLMEEELIKFDYSYSGFDNISHQNGFNQYSLRLDDRFINPQDGDEIYAFRFHKMKYLEERADLVFFVSYQRGIIGYYNTNIRDKDYGDGIIEATANTFTITLPTAVGVAGKESVTKFFSYIEISKVLTTMLLS